VIILSIKDSACPHGYTEEELIGIIGQDSMIKFWNWMDGQTVALCDGREYNYDTREYRDSACVDNPHGIVVYRWDLERYLRRLPVID
jgi:hypothetical protein